jgi:hypothetical protein
VVEKVKEKEDPKKKSSSYCCEARCAPQLLLLPSFLPSIWIHSAPASAAAGSTTPSSSIVPFLSVLGDHNEDDDANDDARKQAHSDDMT